MIAPNMTLEIGVIGRAHGLAGAVSFQPHNRDSDTLAVVKRISLDLPSGARVFAIRSARRVPHGAWVLQLDGIADRTAAEGLLNAIVRIDPSVLPPPAEDEFYYHAAVGARVVTRSGTAIGIVTDIFRTSTDVLVVDRGSAGELLVPIVPDYVVNLDTDNRCVTVVDDAVELLDLGE